MLRYRIGIDGGGTGTRARLCSVTGAVLGEGRAGPSGLGLGAEAAWRHIAQAVEAAFAAAGLPMAEPAVCAIGLGLAGAGRAPAREAFLRADPGYAQLRLTRDVHALLIGAHAGRPGIVVAIGTGSVAAARYSDGTLQLAGGWGFPLGDEGGGAWLGQQALRLGQAVADGRAPASPLSQAVMAQAGGSADALAAFVLGADQSACAALAPVVLACAQTGDPQARALLALAADETARLVHALQPPHTAALPVVVAGSLGPHVSAYWPAELVARCTPADGDACDGALRLLTEGTSGDAWRLPALPRRCGVEADAKSSAPASAGTASRSRLWQGALLTPAGWLLGTVQIADGRILCVQGEPITEARARAADTLMLPGFIDLHLHGGGGADTMEAGDAVERLARLHLRHGTTALLATTMTAPLAEIEAALRALAPLCKQRPAGTARVLGVHLEGPYISPDRLGAQPAFARAPSLAEIQSLQALAPIRVLTLAPEVPAMLALIPALVDAGIRVQIGHSNASYEQARAALQAGASGFTHLFNAMSPLQHRAPGVAGVALAHAQQAELIPDLLHVHPGAIRAALRAVPGLYAVTDATAAAGMPEGDYRLGRQTVTHCLGAVRLPDGTLAGSTLTMDRALRNLVSIGVPLATASACVSARPAAYLGLDDRGTLAAGAWADAVVLDAATLMVREVIVEGESVAP